MTATYREFSPFCGWTYFFGLGKRQLLMCRWCRYVTLFFKRWLICPQLSVNTLLCLIPDSFNGYIYIYIHTYTIYIYTNTYAFTYTYEFLQCWYLRFHLSILHLFSARFLHHLVTCGQRIAQLTGYFLQVLDGDVFVMGRVNPQRFIGVVELLGISWGSQVFFRCRMPDSYQPIGKAAALGGLVVVKPCNKKAKHTQYFYLLWVWCIEIIYVFYIYTYLYLFAHQHGRSAFVQLMDIVTDNSHTPSICSAATVILDQYTECSRQPTVSEDTGYKTSFIHLQSPFQSLQCWLTHWILCQV